MKRGTPGRRITLPYSGYDVDSVVPWPLPPRPALALNAAQALGIDQAMLALGRLSGLVNNMGRLPPRVEELFVWREALMAMSAAKLRLPLDKLLMHEAGYPTGEVPPHMLATARNALTAHELGLARLGQQEPVHSELMKELHRMLTGAPRRNKYGVSSHLSRPGEYRHTLVWTDTLRRVDRPNLRSPPSRVPALMRNLDDFMASNGAKPSLPGLVRAALAHAQNELVYPFADDGPRTSLLYTGLFLRSLGLTSGPMLQLSEPLVRYRLDYLRALDSVLDEGDWENWTHFFSWWLINAAERTAMLIRRVTEMRAEHMALIAGLKRARPSVTAVFQALTRDLVATPKQLVASTGFTTTPVSKALTILAGWGIVRELTGFSRYRVFRYEPLVQLLSSGTGMTVPGPARAPRVYQAPGNV